MASIEKVREYMQATETMETFNTMITTMMDAVTNNLLSEGDDDIALKATLDKKVILRLAPHVEQRAAEFLCAHTDDADLDYLIEQHNHPTNVRMRALSPALSVEMFKVAMALQPKMEEWFQEELKSMIGAADAARDASDEDQPDSEAAKPTLN